MPANTFYRGAIEALTSTLALPEGLQSCLQFIGEYIPSDLLAIHLWDEDLLSLRIHAVASHDQALILDKIVPIAEEFRHITRWQDGYGIRHYNNSNDDPISQLVERAISDQFGEHNYSHMISRVLIDGHRICDVIVMARGRDRFNDEHEALFSGLDQPFGIAVSNSLKHREISMLHQKLLGDNQKLRSRLNQSPLIEDVIGSDGGLKHVMAKAKEVAFTDVPVLITGETGVGKDVIAHTLQGLSSRSHGSFIRVNCGAIPETLLDSELFGHEKGAFTGAQARKAGLFERADKGTIFLDEVGELSKAAQVKLLRVLQNGELERVGASHLTKVDVRVIAATNQALEQLVEREEFRSDLYYRLCLFPIHIPPLRQRLEDIPLFVRHFMENAAYKFRLAPPVIAKGEIDRLLQYSWPGNIRELLNVVERSVLSSVDKPLRFKIGNSVRNGDKNVSPQENEHLLSMDQAVVKHIEQALSLSQGRIQGPKGAAELLQMNPYTLRSRIKKLRINYSAAR